MSSICESDSTSPSAWLVSTYLNTSLFPTMLSSVDEYISCSTSEPSCGGYVAAKDVLLLCTHHLPQYPVNDAGALRVPRCATALHMCPSGV